MKVFISWSGEASRDVALALRDWFPKVLQSVKPFVSAKDIDKGANWAVELTRELRDSEFGVVCVTPENTLSPWLNYEAGAMTSSMTSRVCPVLLGVNKTEVRPPMAQLQLTELNKDDVKLLMKSMNNATASPLEAGAVDEAVDTWWPRLEQNVQAITVPEWPSAPEESAPEPPKPAVLVEEMTREVLERVRRMDSRQTTRMLPQLNRRIRSQYKTSRDEHDWETLGRSLEDSKIVNSGMDIRGIDFGDGALEITVDTLAIPLPERASMLLAQLSASNQILVILRDLHGIEVIYRNGIQMVYEDNDPIDVSSF